MTSTTDKMGRPIVVVTGLGVVTSLGAGKTDNWAKLTAGESGIHAITRFATDGMRTRIAGTIDYLAGQPLNSAALAETIAELAAEEAIAESGIGTIGDFPGPLFLAVPPIEMEWPQRLEIAQAPAPTTQITYDDLLRVSRQISRHTIDASCSVRSPTTSPTASAPRARRSRCRPPAPPAPARSSSASRRSAAARPTRRSASAPTDRSIRKRLVRFSLLSALSTQQRRCRKRGQAVLQEPRRIRHGRRRRRAGAGKLRRRPRRAAPRSSASSKAAAKWPTPSTAPARAPTASRSSAASATP